MDNTPYLYVKSSMFVTHGHECSQEPCNDSITLVTAPLRLFGASSTWKSATDTRKTRESKGETEIHVH